MILDYKSSNIKYKKSSTIVKLLGLPRRRSFHLLLILRLTLSQLITIYKRPQGSRLIIIKTITRVPAAMR